MKVVVVIPETTVTSEAKSGCTKLKKLTTPKIGQTGIGSRRRLWTLAILVLKFL